jgi:hypothetical protein
MKPLGVSIPAPLGAFVLNRDGGRGVDGALFPGAAAAFPTYQCG